MKAAQPAYRRIAKRVADDIRNGTLAPGEKLPSVRQLCAFEAVSPPTAQQALRELEAQGLVVARPRSGFYVAQRNSPAPRHRSPTLRPRPITLVSEVHELFANARLPGTLSLGAASPASEWLPTAALTRALGSAQRRLGAEAHAYSVPPGRLELRRQIAQRGRRWGWKADADDLVITSGQTQALQLALRAVCRRGDVVAVESPCYFGTLMQLRAAGVKVVEVRTDPLLGMDLRSLETVLSTHRVSAVVANPTANNPAGFTMPIESKRALVRLLEAERVPLIEDDVYGELSNGRPRAPACKAFDEGGNVLYCSSASKTLAPGWRIGWIAPGRFMHAVLDARVELSLAGTPALESAVADLMMNGDYDRHVHRFRERFARSVRAVEARVTESWPQGTRVRMPVDGFLVWIELPPSVAALRLHDQAMQEGISICPGIMFSADGKQFRHHLRLNCAMPATPALLASIDRIGILASNIAARTS